MSMKPALLLYLFSVCAWAQVSITGSLRGIIHDSQSSRVPQTMLTLTNAESGQSIKTVANGAGQYVFSNLVPGAYTLSAEHPGFRQALKEGVAVTVAEAATADIELEVGQTTETVTVTAGTEFVQAHSSEVSALVNERRIRDLPLNGKNFQQLILLSPGVSLLGTPNNPTIAGGRAATNTYSIDGTSANDERTPQAIANYGGAAGNTDAAPSIISTEAIREFRVINSNADATYGRGSGGQISAVTKSGTNELHGSAYEYFRNDALDARDFFNVGPFRDSEGHAKVPPFKQNLFGATTGGPIVHNRHFFFASYEGFRQTKRLQTAATAIVPNADLIGLIPGDLGKLYKTFYIDRGIVTVGKNPGLTPLSAADRAAGASRRLQSGPVRWRSRERGSGHACHQRSAHLQRASGFAPDPHRPSPHRQAERQRTVRVQSPTTARVSQHEHCAGPATDAAALADRRRTIYLHGDAVADCGIARQRAAKPLCVGPGEAARFAPGADRRFAHGRPASHRDRYGAHRHFCLPRQRVHRQSDRA